MRKLRQIFRSANIRRYARIMVWLFNHIGLLLCASLEVYLHRNLGRRYMRKVCVAFLLCLAFVSAAPAQAILMRAFVTGFFVMLIFQIGFNSARRYGRHPEPHSYWYGDPWRIWHEFGLSSFMVRCFCEPAMCFLLSWLTSQIDPFFSAWVGAAAFSLFLKEQVEWIGLRRRVLDMVDSRIESQRLTSAVDQYTNRGGAQQERPHRAHLP